MVIASVNVKVSAYQCMFIRATRSIAASLQANNYRTKEPLPISLAQYTITTRHLDLVQFTLHNMDVPHLYIYT